MIEIRKLTFFYSGQHKLFEEFTLTLPRGEALSIVGPSGCGKSTLLYILAGLVTPAAGTIIINGSKVQRPRPETGLVLQDHGLLPWSTVAENARLGWVIRGFYGPDGRHSPRGTRVDRTAAHEKVDQWLRRLHIDHLRDKYPSQLSRGQRQRAAIARTLAMEPDLLLMDEPFSALDAVIREELHKTMRQFRQESGITSVIVTHDIEEALLVGRKILVLRSGCNRAVRMVDNPLTPGQEEIELESSRRSVDELRRILEES